MPDTIKCVDHQWGRGSLYRHRYDQRVRGAATVDPRSLPAHCLLGFRAFESAIGKNRFAVCGLLTATIFCVILGTAGCGGGSATVPPPLPTVTPSGTSAIVITPSAMSPSGQPLQLQPIQLTLTVK
jgi:hypothetical protein